MSQRSVEVMKLVRFDGVFRRAVDGCDSERANPVLSGYAGCLKVVNVVTAVEMMFYASFDDCCAAVCSSVRVLCVISSVVGEFEVVPRGEVRFRYEHDIDLLGLYILFNFFCMLGESDGIPYNYLELHLIHFGYDSC